MFDSEIFQKPILEPRISKIHCTLSANQKRDSQSEIRHTDISLSRNKKVNWEPSSGRLAKKMKCCNRLIHKQFVQVSCLCGPQFLSYLPKRFTHLCRALYGDAILVHQNGAAMAARNQQKHLEFTFSIKALSFHLRTSIRAHKHIF